MSKKKLTEKDFHAALTEIFGEALKEAMARWERDFGPPEMQATPGAVLRVPDAVLKQYGVPYPASICVLRIDGGDAVTVPIRISGKVAAGEFAIPEKLSPFLDVMILEMDCSLRFPSDALQAFIGLAQCPAVVGLPPVQMLIPHRNKRAVFAAWKRLIESLPSPN